MVKMMINLKEDFVKVQRSGLVEGSDYSHLAIAKFVGLLMKKFL